jgi:hypothetical protein
MEAYMGPNLPRALLKAEGLPRVDAPREAQTPSIHILSACNNMP